MVLLVELLFQFQVVTSFLDGNSSLKNKMKYFELVLDFNFEYNDKSRRITLLRSPCSFFCKSSISAKIRSVSDWTCFLAIFIRVSSFMRVAYSEFFWSILPWKARNLVIPAIQRCSSSSSVSWSCSSLCASRSMKHRHKSSQNRMKLKPTMSPSRTPYQHL